MYVPGPLTHRAQLLSGAAPLPKFKTAVQGFWSQQSHFRKIPKALKRVSGTHTPEKQSLAPVSSPDEGIWSRNIRTNKTQGITAVAIHARCAHIDRPIEVEVQAVAIGRALHIPTRGVRLDKVG